jgi:hypothetical protein
MYKLAVSTHILLILFTGDGGYGLCICWSRHSPSLSITSLLIHANEPLINTSQCSDKAATTKLLSAVLLKIQVFWYVTPCRLTNTYGVSGKVTPSTSRSTWCWRWTRHQWHGVHIPDYLNLLVLYFFDILTTADKVVTFQTWLMVEDYRL